MSCSSPGNCSAGGSYTDSSGRTQAFIDSEVNGTWHTPIEVPGTAALNHGGSAAVNSMSCTSAGNCSAVGSYRNNSTQAFAVSEVNGIWHKAIEVPGIAVLNTGGYAGLASVSCAKPGNCTAGGYYLDNSNSYQSFTASEVNGIWHKAIEVPGTASIAPSGHPGPNAGVSSVSCVSAGRLQCRRVVHRQLGA